MMYKISNQLWFKALIFILFLVTVNVIAGWIAITFRYPSLYNVTASFAEYAFPLPFYWGLVHIPSMLVYGLPLLMLSQLKEQHIQYFRIFCLATFFILLLELDKKIPFLLFPKVDAIIALGFSFVLFPPSAKENPKQILALKLFAFMSMVVGSYLAFSVWQHQTPVVSSRYYADGLFELRSIIVNQDHRREMIFEVALKSEMPENQLCALSQPMAHALLQDYPFDSNYKKLIKVFFNPTRTKADHQTYKLGEISLSKAHQSSNGDYPCYLKYKSTP